MASTETSAEGVVVAAGNDRSTSKLLSQLKNPKIRIGLGVVLLLIGVFLIVHALQAAFIIDGKRYSKSSISAMATYASNEIPRYTKATAAKAIFSMYKTQVAAQKAGIVPTNSEIQAAQKTLSLPQATSSNAAKQYVQLVAYTIALPSSYMRYEEGGYTGTYFVFDFSEKVQATAFQEQPVAGYHDPTLIAQDQQYAKQQAYAAYKLYGSNRNSLTKIQSNITTAEQTIGFTGRLAKFGPNNGTLNSQVLDADVYTYITSQTKPGLSQIKVGTVLTTLNAKDGQNAPGYYYFVDLTKVGKVVANPSKAINDQLGKLHARYYGI